MTGSRSEEYRRNAEEAERRALAAKTADERAAYWRIAQGWRDLEALAARREQLGR